MKITREEGTQSKEIHTTEEEGSMEAAGGFLEERSYYVKGGGQPCQKYWLVKEVRIIAKG